MLEIYKERLREKFSQATNNDIHYGMNWYKTAYFKCSKVAKVLNVPLDRFIAIVAVLSPQKRWEKNICEAIQFVRKGHKAKIFATRKQKDKCRDILRASDSEFKTMRIGGLKVTSFFKNMLKPLISDTVTIDRHAMRSIGFDKSLTSKQYGIIEQAHRDVAKEFEIRPHELQAVIWSVVR